MVLEVILVIVVLPLVALGLSLAWSNRLGRRRAVDEEVEAAWFVRSGR
jgi:type II secretory pathway pseudopilin PulG